jgi:hypothetical protein
MSRWKIFLEAIAPGFSAILENDEKEWIIKSVPQLGKHMCVNR